jgi:hypothetical protein
VENNYERSSDNIILLGFWRVLSSCTGAATSLSVATNGLSGWRINCCLSPRRIIHALSKYCAEQLTFCNKLGLGQSGVTIANWTPFS